jgi:hypothetical protein
MSKIFFHRPWIGLAAGAALTLASATALAGDMGTAPNRHAALMEMETAQFFAGYATHAKTDAAARTDLREARACLLGERADAAQPDPCTTEGHGALSDATDPARQALAREALWQVNDGLNAKDLTMAQAFAQQAIGTLRMADE